MTGAGLKTSSCAVAFSLLKVYSVRVNDLIPDQSLYIPVKIFPVYGIRHIKILDPFLIQFLFLPWAVIIVLFHDAKLLFAKSLSQSGNKGGFSGTTASGYSDQKFFGHLNYGACSQEGRK